MSVRSNAMKKTLASICVGLLLAVGTFATSAQAQRHGGGAHYSGVRVGGAHFSGARIAGAHFSGARVGASYIGRPAIYGGSVQAHRYAQVGYRYGHYGYRHRAYRPYWGWGVATGALASAWPYYYDDYAYVGDDYYYDDGHFYEPAVSSDHYGGGGCWIVTDSTRGFGYYGPCN
jgi:hypothetical protein